MHNIGIQKYFAIRAPRLWSMAFFISLGFMASFSQSETVPVSQNSSSSSILTQYADAGIWNKYRDVHLKNKKSSPATDNASLPFELNDQFGTTTFPIVYSRVPRMVGNHTATISGVEYTSDKWDFYDSLPETGRITDSFTGPGQLVYRYTNGTEEIIYDCMSAVKPCVPFDASISLDGTKVAFSVYQSDALAHAYPANRNYPPMVLSGINSEARIYIYDIAAKVTTAWPHVVGVHDISPVWLPGGKMVFNSDRNGYHDPQIHPIPNSATKNLRMYSANDDGSVVVDITPHEITAAIHPFVLNTGRIVYSSKWVSHNMIYTKKTQINYPDTPDNFWVIQDTDLRGGDTTAVLGAHHMRFVGSDSRSNTVKALHFIGQRDNGDVCIVNYYRANNNGLGDVICYPPQAHGVEGPKPNFTPLGLYDIAAWTNSNDNGSTKLDGVYGGKLGWPEGIPNNQMMFTLGRGYCTNVNRAALLSELKKLEANDAIGCDTGIYKTTVIPSLHPNDMALIVDDPAWHEFNARMVRPRAVAEPSLAATSTGDGSCELSGTDADHTDAHNYAGYDFNNNTASNMNNGSEINGLPHSDMIGLRFYEVIPNLTKPDGFKTSIGNQVKVFGDVPLESDGSWRVKLPCDTPYLMAGIDVDGRLIKRDQIAQSLRPGEKRKCIGCHLHGAEHPSPTLAPIAEALTPLVFTASTDVPTYTNNVLPILQARCQGCHDAAITPVTDVSSVPLYDYDKLVWDYFQDDVPNSMKLVTRAELPGTVWEHHLQRPQSSKYVDTRYARTSLLYWKVSNERKDGRTDATYGDDIDFGAAHPTTVTAVELKIIGDWLDSGATE